MGGFYTISYKNGKDWAFGSYDHAYSPRQALSAQYLNFPSHWVECYAKIASHRTVESGKDVFRYWRKVR